MPKNNVAGRLLPASWLLFTSSLTRPVSASSSSGTRPANAAQKQSGERCEVLFWTRRRENDFVFPRYTLIPLRLAGTIPPELGNLRDLLTLGLNNNQLTGNVMVFVLVFFKPCSRISPASISVRERFPGFLPMSPYLISVIFPGVLLDERRGGAGDGSHTFVF